MAALSRSFGMVGLVLLRGGVRHSIPDRRQDATRRSEARPGNALGCHRRRERDRRRGARRRRAGRPGRGGGRCIGGHARPRDDRERRSALREELGARATDGLRACNRCRARRDHERDFAARRGRLRAALRSGKCGPVRRAARCNAARAAGTAGRRRHVGRPRTSARPCRQEHRAVPEPTGTRVRIAVLTGGVGGSRFLCGLVDAVDPAEVTAIVNVGDDVEVLGLSVSPDLDSVLYALAGLADEERGWGRAEETWHAVETVEALGGEAWFRLGDHDLGLHLVRTQARREGQSLSVVSVRLAAAFGVEATILPASDDTLRTWLDTPNGSFPFQEWFVARSQRVLVVRVIVPWVARAVTP